MKTHEAYQLWADTYDSMSNKTRDLEAKAIRAKLGEIKFESGLELGCGTGKNTSWLAERCEQLVALDFSAAMLEQAKNSVGAEHVNFIECDLNKPWPLTTQQFDVITCSLVLEHFENLVPIFQKAANYLRPGGIFYHCELHPIKQMMGSQANFDEGAPECYTHHVSEYIRAGQACGLELDALDEWFDESAEQKVPRLLSIIWKQP